MTGPGRKSQQGDGVSGPERLILGTEEVIRGSNIGEVCQPTVLRLLSSPRRAIPRTMYSGLTLKKLLERENRAAPLNDSPAHTGLQRSLNLPGDL